MKAFICVIASLIAIRSCIAYTEAELNFLYGNNVGRTPLDDMMEEASKPVSMSMQEYRAIQATNQIPILAEVIASNIAHAVQAGQSTNGVTWTKADELRMSILPPPCPNEGWMHQRSRHLMMLMGVQPGDMSAVCTNWIMPSNICVNGIYYEVSCDGPDDFEIHAATNMQQSVAYVRHHELSNGKDARTEGFMMYLRNVNRGQVGTAFGLSISNLDPVTNMMFLSSKKDVSPPCDILIYKNLVLHVYAPTNALLFAAEIVNSGLPEADRIPFPPTP